MDIVLAIFIGLVVGLAFGGWSFVRRARRLRFDRELNEIVSSRDPEAALRQLDERIAAQREVVADLEASAGVIHAGGGEEHINREHRELARLQELRQRASERFSSRR